jgi:hypothetical protein
MGGFTREMSLGVGIHRGNPNPCSTSLLGVPMVIYIAVDVWRAPAVLLSTVIRRVHDVEGWMWTSGPSDNCRHQWRHSRLKICGDKFKRESTAMHITLAKYLAAGRASKGYGAVAPARPHPAHFDERRRSNQCLTISSPPLFPALSLFAGLRNCVLFVDVERSHAMVALRCF